MSPATAGKSLRAAVVGLGGMGRRHLQALAQAGIPVVAVCDIAPAAAEGARALCGQPPRDYTDWRTLLAAEASQLDLITIATNGPSHHEIATAAARSGMRYVLCEKPMATSGRKARDMAKACEAAGARLAVNLSRRFAERFLRVKALLAAGTIGGLVHINVSVGAGGLGNIGTHYFDFVAWLADTQAAWVIGDVDRESARNARGEQFRDPGGRGLVGYANGVTACFQFADAAAITPFMQIVGTDGFIVFDGPPNRGRLAIHARPAEKRDTPKTRHVESQRVDIDPGAPLDVVQTTRACIEDLVGPHREETASGGIAAVDTVMAFHLSARRDWAKIALPLAGGDLDFDVPIT